jgi:endonuclease III
MAHRTTPLSKHKIIEIFERLKALNPDPKTELEFKNPYTLLVAVALSAQATDISVNKATGPLFAKVDTPQKMLALGEVKLKEYIKTIGLFNTKAKNVIALSQKLVDEYGGEVPAIHSELVKLPGVGRKTANVVMNEAFGEPTIAVDTHIFRVSHRLNLSKGKTPDAVEADLHKVIPDEYKLKAHHWILLHGRYTCKARVPECPTCVIRDVCPFEPKTQATMQKLSKSPAGR